jgi:hypothetical protein
VASSRSLARRLTVEAHGGVVEEVAHEGVGGAQQTAPSGGTQWIGERRWQGDRRRIGGQWMAHMVVAVGRQRRA